MLFYRIFVWIRFLFIFVLNSIFFILDCFLCFLSCLQRVYLSAVFFYKISVGNKFLIIFARIINFFIKVFLDVKQSIVGFIINSHYVFLWRIFCKKINYFENIVAYRYTHYYIQQKFIDKKTPLGLGSFFG